jgi:hypothetical protein
MTTDDIAIWTGGAMRASDALARLLRDGFPYEDLDVGVGELPIYDRRVHETHDSADARWRAAVRRWEEDRRASVLQRAGEDLARLIARDAVTRAHPAEWRGDKGAEAAVLKLAAEHCRRFPASSLVYVFGPNEMLADLAKQGTTQPNVAGPRGAATPPQATTYPGIKVRSYFGFMTATLAFVSVAGLPYPVTVGCEAYSVGIFMPSLTAPVVSIGAMPREAHVGVVGASVEQVIADLATKAEGPPTFDPQDWKTKLRLRRLAAKGDNPG